MSVRQGDASHRGERMARAKLKDGFSSRLPGSIKAGGPIDRPRYLQGELFRARFHVEDGCAVEAAEETRGPARRLGSRSLRQIGTKPLRGFGEERRM